MNNITLKIADRNLEFAFGLGFLGELFERTGLDINVVATDVIKNPFKMIPLLMYHSNSYSEMRAGREVSFTLYEFIDWLDESGGLGNPNTKVFLDAFKKSLTRNIPKTDLKEPDSKKK